MKIDLWKLDHTCRKVKRKKQAKECLPQEREEAFGKKFVRLRKKERTEDALALIGEEGRDEQRNATGSSK